MFRFFTQRQWYSFFYSQYKQCWFSGVVALQVVALRVVIVVVEGGAAAGEGDGSDVVVVVVVVAMILVVVVNAEAVVEVMKNFEAIGAVVVEGLLMADR